MKILGHTQIDNDFIDTLYNFTEAETKIFLTISRKTTGWHKISDRISYSQLRKITGLSTNGLKAGIKGLVDSGWIRQEKSTRGFVYDLNITVSMSDTAEYQPVTQPLSLTDTETPETVSMSDTTKEKEPKKLLKEKDTVSYLDDLFKASNPDYYRDSKQVPHLKYLATRLKTAEEIQRAFNGFKSLITSNDKFYSKLPLTPAAMRSRIDEALKQSRKKNSIYE